MKQISERIYFDEASPYSWEELNETEFLTRFFAHLKAEMGAGFGRYSFYILSTHDAGVVPESLELEESGKVLVYMSDESSSIPTHLSSRYHAIFKSYLPRELPGTNVFPFHLGYVKNVAWSKPKPLAERKVNVFFSGNLNANRAALLRALHPVLRHLPACLPDRAVAWVIRRWFSGLLGSNLTAGLPDSYIRFTGGFKGGLSPDEYGNMLADSRIVLCPKGFESPETFRHMEAMRAGAVVISEMLPDTHFYRDSPICGVPDWRSGVALAKELCADPNRLEALHEATVKWWREVCSEAATARFVHHQLRDLESRAGTGQASRSLDVMVAASAPGPK